MRLHKLLFIGMVLSLIGVSLSIPIINFALAIFLLIIVLNFRGVKKFYCENNFKNPISSYFLLLFSFFMVLSVIFNYKNYDSVDLFYGAILKIRYYLIPLFIMPLLPHFFYEMTEKQKNFLLIFFLVAIFLSNASGIAAMFFGGFNFLKNKSHASCIDRNCGMFDIMTYAHNTVVLLLVMWGIGFWLIRQGKKRFFYFFIISITIQFLGFYLSYTFGAWISFFFSVTIFLSP